MTSKEDNFFSKINGSFRHEVVKEVIKSSCSNSKKISDDVISLISELAKIMIMEAAMRAAQNNTHNAVINLDSVETVLPQIMLDFP